MNSLVLRKLCFECSDLSHLLKLSNTLHLPLFESHVIKFTANIQRGVEQRFLLAIRFEFVFESFDKHCSSLLYVLLLFDVLFDDL